MSSLRVLNIFVKKKNSLGLNSLLSNLSLKELKITALSYDCTLTKLDCEAIANFICENKTLEELSFDMKDDVEGDWEVEDLRVIFKALTRNDSLPLKTLDLGGISYNNYMDLTDLDDYIGKSSNLSNLNLPPRISLCASSAPYIFDALNQKPFLKLQNEGSFVCEVCGDVDIRALFDVINNYPEMLVEPNTIRDLRNITDEGVEELAECLQENTTVEELDLSCTGIGDTAAEALAQMLNSNTSLKWLNLSSNKIGDAGARVLAEAFYNNSTLKNLDLRCNVGIGEEGVSHLIQALTVNESIGVVAGRGNCTGLILDKSNHERHAVRCSEYNRVKHRIAFN